MGDFEATTDSTLYTKKRKQAFGAQVCSILLFQLDDLMLAACRNDQDEMLEDIFKEGEFDINHQDGVGDSALHYAQV
jgi:histidinol phosphatase-like enzyme